MKALLLALTLLLPFSAYSQNVYNLPSLNSDDPRDDRGANDCCTAADPVDSNFCFDSWEEYDLYCKTSTKPDTEAPSVDDDKQLD